MHERLKKIRKDAKMTQTQFAAAIGATRSMVASYEAAPGTKGAVEPRDTIINVICSKFNVNERWLRTGDGSQYCQKKSLIPELERVLRRNPALHEAMNNFVDKMTDDDWDTILSALNRIIGST